MNAPLEARLDFLRRSQNPDGGWGFFPHKQSWLEPTAYAMLVLRGEPAWDRAWNWMRGLQLADGSWPASGQVREPHWTTALAVNLHATAQVADDAFRRGVDWLVSTSGKENGLLFRAVQKLRPGIVELDASVKAWPWRPGASSWIEPTAHSLVALKKAAPLVGEARVKDRIEQGERMILDRRCADGGWNYGNRKVLGHELTSYPETTALALYGLHGRSGLTQPVEAAKRMLNSTRSPLARAWLAVALREHGVQPPELAAAVTTDVLVAALEVIAVKGGLI
jgi:hypothetical protein